MGMFLMTLLMITGVLLMFIVLLQRGRGGGLAGAFGGAGGQSAFGTRAGDVFTKITVGLAVVWVVLAGLSGFALRADAKSKYRGESPETPEVKAKDDSKEKSATRKPEAETSSEEKTDEKGSTETKPGDGEKPADSEKPTTESPATDKPADEKPTDEKPTTEKPAEKKADDKPAEEKKTDGEKPTESEKKPE